MSGNKINMEELFRSRFENYSVEPSRGLWARVHNRILLKQFFRFSLNSFNVYYLIAALALLTGGMLLIPSSQDEQAITGTGTSAAEIPGSTISTQDTVYRPGETEMILPARDRSPAIDQEVPEDPVTVDGMRSESESLPGRVAPEPVAITEPENRQAEIPEPVQPSPPPGRIAFSVSHTSGCAPLSVTFNNASENAGSFQWTFGDGTGSMEEDPVHVYQESGEFTAVLRMTGTDGQEYMKQQTIQVFEKPRALFELDEQKSISEPVYFYNYSESARYYEWDFGDQQKSRLSDPVHYYNTPGSYRVKLIAWNEHQCFDSLIIYDAFSSHANKLRFPNAFTPNLSGPSGGYYDGNEINNTIFHPAVTGEVIEYQLQIFNRNGILVFECSDLQTGWDGYIREELAPQGVYVWKATGKFSNGETFMQTGDVTLIRRY